MTIISPFPFPGPVRAIILLDDFHSADKRQSQPQIVNPAIYLNKLNFFFFQFCMKLSIPIKSFARVPKNSPLIVTFVPGGPSFGDKPVTTGAGAIKLFFYLINNKIILFLVLTGCSFFFNKRQLK